VIFGLDKSRFDGIYFFNWAVLWYNTGNLFMKNETNFFENKNFAYL